jgi:hypothetical protein
MRTLILTTALAIAAIPSASASAGLVTFTFQGSASGTIGSLNFSDRAFTVFANADDSSLITDGSGTQSLANGSAFIAIDGVGAFMLFSPTRTYLDVAGSVSFAMPGEGPELPLLAGALPAGMQGRPIVESVSTVSLSGSRLSPGAWQNPLSPVLTSGGALSLTSLGGNGLSFTSFSSVPAPGSIALLGAATLVGARRRR